MPDGRATPDRVQIEYTVCVDGTIIAAFSEMADARRARCTILTELAAGRPIPSLMHDGRLAPRS